MFCKDALSGFLADSSSDGGVTPQAGVDIIQFVAIVIDQNLPPGFETACQVRLIVSNDRCRHKAWIEMALVQSDEHMFFMADVQHREVRAIEVGKLVDPDAAALHHVGSLGEPCPARAV